MDRKSNGSPARHRGLIWALVDHLTDRPAAASVPLAVDADLLRRKSSAWSSYPPHPGLVDEFRLLFETERTDSRLFPLRKR